MANPSSLFVGHGAPSLAISTHPAAQALRDLGRRLARPAAVIVLSPHRHAVGFEVGQAPAFHAAYDFRGFAPELRTLRYDAPGHPTLASRVVQAIRAAGLPSRPSDDARLDHGIWVPLRLMWPEADVPVVPVSTNGSGPDAHLDLGGALQAFTRENVLVIGSGSLVHNLGETRLEAEFDPPDDWAQTFDDWIADCIAAQDLDALCNYRDLGYPARMSHPQEEHLMPLYVALGAGGAGQPLYRGFSHRNLSLSSYAFQ